MNRSAYERKVCRALSYCVEVDASRIWDEYYTFLWSCAEGTPVIVLRNSPRNLIPLFFLSSFVLPYEEIISLNLLFVWRGKLAQLAMTERRPFDLRLSCADSLMLLFSNASQASPSFASVDWIVWSIRLRSDLMTTVSRSDCIMMLRSLWPMSSQWEGWMRASRTRQIKLGYMVLCRRVDDLQ